MNNIIVISLEKAPDRRKRITAQLNKLQLQAIIMDAIDGDLLSDKEKDRKLSLPGGWREGETFQPGEIGCTMSHIKALEFAKELGWESVIIMEDDLVLADDFESRVNTLYRIVPENWEMIYLSGIPRTPPLETQLIFPNVQPAGVVDCIPNYIIRKSAYNKVIDYLSTFQTTTDDMYTNLILKNKLKAYIYYPFVSYVSDNHSYIWNTELKRIHKSNNFKKK